MRIFDAAEQLSMLGPDTESGRMSSVSSAAASPRVRTSASSWRNSSELVTAPYQCLALRPGAGNLLGSYWENNAPWLGGSTMLNTGASPNAAAESTLSQILEAIPHPKYYLSSTACLGILRRAEKRGKALPPQLKAALELQAAVDAQTLGKGPSAEADVYAFHINQREETIDLGGVSGALLATRNMQMQTFVAQQTVAFAANQRDEVRDLHDVASAIQAQPGMKQQTFVAQCLNPWDTQQARVSVPQGVAPTMAGADGGGGRNPAGLVMAAGFCGKAGSKARDIGFESERSPTLTSNTPTVLCLNDQGGQRMDLSENMTGTLRAQMDGHPPLVLASQQGGAEIGVDICPTLTAAAGVSGNNQPVLHETHGMDTQTYCVSGNTIDRQPQNGGNGLGCQEDIAYTLTATDHHAVYQKTVGALCRGDEKGVGNQYVSQDKCIIAPTNFIRRLTPLECERLQGFPDFWTGIEGASDSARYKALGNSVAIPCVEHVLRGVSFILSQEEGGHHI